MIPRFSERRWSRSAANWARRYRCKTVKGRIIQLMRQDSLHGLATAAAYDPSLSSTHETPTRYFDCRTCPAGRGRLEARAAFSRNAGGRAGPRIAGGACGTGAKRGRGNCGHGISGARIGGSGNASGARQAGRDSRGGECATGAADHFRQRADAGAAAQHRRRPRSAE